MVKKPPKPAGLGSEGARLWRSVTAEMAKDDVVPTSSERRWLEDACRTADAIAAMEAALDGQPMIVKGSQGQPVANPLLGEIRQHRSVLAQLLGRVKLFAEDEDAGTGRGGKTTSIQARRAVMTRHYGSVSGPGA